MIPLITPEAPTTGVSDVRVGDQARRLGRQACQNVEREETKAPIESSVLSPKIHKNHMFPIRCIQLPCRNIDVSSAPKVSPPGRHAILTAPCPVISPGIPPRPQTDPSSTASDAPAP